MYFEYNTFHQYYKGTLAPVSQYQKYKNIHHNWEWSIMKGDSILNISVLYNI